MKSKNSPLNIRKLPYNVALVLLTAGASLILGFLSFGGMFALIPMLSVAFAAFGLSVAYEGEIYLQNIKGALSKLLKRDYLEQHLAKEYLLAHAPLDEKGAVSATAPQFFHDYEKQLHLLATFGHKTLDKDSKKAKKSVKKTLADMEKRFAIYLFGNVAEATPYTSELCDWLKQNKQDEWQKTLASRKTKFNLVKAFSLLSAAFMGLGSTYLIVEAFSIIPFFATLSFTLWPLIILPMALVAGAAYGLLTFNAVTDLINNNTVVKWYNKIKHDLSQGVTLRTVFMATMATLLVGLAVALTVCTAGTWWTIASNARPLFDWMHRMPSFVMGVINPVITGASAIFFNIENTAESLHMVDDAIHGDSLLKRITQGISEGISHLLSTENIGQILNPFRLILILTVMPLRVVLFLGHLLSIAVTADRMPGVSQMTSALIAIISEGFEDAHYFVGHSHEHHDHHQNTQELLKERLSAGGGHDHTNDIPTWALKTLATPLYALAAVWDSLFSRFNAANSTNPARPKTISWTQAWNKQMGISEARRIEVSQEANHHPSYQWQQEHALAQINKYERKHLAKTDDASFNQLQKLKKAITEAEQPTQLKAVLAAEEDLPASDNPHRLFSHENKQLKTHHFINNLPQRVNIRVA